MGAPTAVMCLVNGDSCNAFDEQKVREGMVLGYEAGVRVLQG